MGRGRVANRPRRNVSVVSLVLVALIALLVPTTPLAADFVELAELADQFDVSIQWDPYRHVVALWKAGEVITFRPGRDWAIRNFSARIALGETQWQAGNILLSPQAIQTLTTLLNQKREPDLERDIAAIFIDAGHGGKDPGATGNHIINGETKSIREKDVVLSAAKKLRELLNSKFPDKQIILTRDSDIYLTLQERIVIANAIEIEPNETILFISLHANASLNDTAQGFEVWYLPPQYRRPDLVTRSQVGTDNEDVVSILNAIKEEEYTIESVLLARQISEEIHKQVGFDVPNRGLKQESWYVVRNAKMPSVLVEMGFVTNQEEAMRLMDRDYIDRLTTGIYAGIIEFIDSFEQ